MKSTKKVTFEGIAVVDPELDNDLQDLVEKGYIEKQEVEDETIYHITSLGDTYAEEVLGLKRDKSKTN